MGKTTYKKCAMFTDIHWGRKNNSITHNNDCLDFVKWFIKQCKIHKVDHVVFLGDWFQQRSAINGMTLQMSLDGARLLDSLGIPIFFITGNHDLYHRNNREVCVTEVFDSLSNFHVVSKDYPLVIETDGGKAGIFPFLFPEEYPNAVTACKDLSVVFGHFEFKGFVVTGDTYVLDHGPDHTQFSKLTKIFSGHFHKRQVKDNTVFIGNTFPCDFSDANDVDRGMAIYEYKTDDIQFVNWPDCPTYLKIPVSKLTKYCKAGKLSDKSTIKVDLDQSLDFDQASDLKDYLKQAYGMRELNLVERVDTTIDCDIEGVDMEKLKTESTEEIIKVLLPKVESDEISGDKLVKIYEEVLSEFKST